MALQVWLPLNGNLNNQGLSSVTVTNNGAAVDNSGKIGKCYNFNGASYMTLPSFDTTKSICFWLYISNTNNAIVFVDYKSKLAFGFYSGYIATTCASWNIKVYSATNILSGSWNHICLIKGDDDVLLYINGIQETNRYNQYDNWNNSADGLYIGTRSGGDYKLTGKLNDFRIYDHCLSPKEVKEISKGLVLHYKLDDPYVEGTTNIDLFKTSAPNFGYVITCEKVIFKGRECWHYVVGGSSSGWFGVYSSQNGYSAGTTLTRSCYLYVPSGQSTTWWHGVPFAFEGMSSIPSIKKYDLSKLDTWQYCYCTGVAANTSSNFLLYMIAGSNGSFNMEFYISDIQTEEKDHATPYTPSTRSGVPVYDCSGYGRNGTLASTPTIASTTPRYSNCINFTDSATSIAIGDLSTMVPDGNFTFNCWFMKKTGEWSSKGYETIFGGPSGFELEAKRSTTNSPTVIMWNWAQNSGVVYTLDEWHMVTFIRTASATQLYLDGVLKVTGTAGSIPTGQYFIGAWRSATEQNYRGYLSDTRIYSTVLSADDIKELYDTSAIIYNNGTVAAREAIETNNDNVDITKTGIISTQRFIECNDYLYLPAGNGVTTDLYYDNGDTCTAETIIRYASGGSGKDLMGFSGSAAGYWGVTNAGVWEPHGTFSYTDSDITKLNRIFYQYTAQTSVAGDHGYYQIGRLADSYSVRTKYIYNVKLYKNGVLERDLYPASNGTVAGLMDALHGTFYVATGTGSGRSSLGNDEEPTARFYKDHIQLNQIIEI